jgi:uncharacterized metal-binding protein YceD (DUF177 family)
LGVVLGAFGVNIIGLSNTVHQFDFEIGDQFFRKYGTDLLSKGKFRADVELNKHETFIEADFKIQGTATLTCDRSLEEFDFPVKIHHPVVFKYGDHDEELSDEIIMIHRDTATLELGQYIYEFLVLALPMKRLHPKFQQEETHGDENDEGKIVYSSDKESEQKGEEIDPRWNILKKLK